jgi:hypothetical protein
MAALSRSALTVSQDQPTVWQLVRYFLAVLVSASFLTGQARKPGIYSFG